jgi:toxin FitB
MEERLVDSNIIIYSVQSQYRAINQYLQRFRICYSKITMVEVLGYHLLSETDKKLFEVFFSNTVHFGITDEIIQKSIELKQSKKMSLGDSLIAATSILHRIPLITRNIEDFKGMQDLEVIDPFDFLDNG